MVKKQKVDFQFPKWSYVCHADPAVAGEASAI